MLTLKTCYEAIDHKLGIGPDQPLDRLNVVNQAGAILYSHAWGWLQNAAWTLTLGAGSDRVPLPPDAGEIRTVVAADGYTTRVELYSSVDELAHARSVYPDGVASRLLLVAPMHERRQNAISSFLTVWPTQTAATSLLACGRRRWVTMQDDLPPESSYVPLPDMLPVFETLFLELVRAYASGYERDGTTDVQAEIARVMGGPLWTMADGADVRAFGGQAPMRNTALMMASGRGVPFAARETYTNWP